MLHRKKALRGLFSWYNLLMDYVQAVIEAFWLMLQASASMLVPLIVIFLVFSLIRGLLFNER